MMCAYKEGTGTCEGDSGGPLATLATEPPLQVGIVSFGYSGDCEEDAFALTLYTRVSHYNDWITSTVCEAAGELCSSSKSGKSSKSGSGNSSKSSKSQVPSSVSAEEDVAVVHDEMDV
ncbi:hypothetical protein QTG54_016650 [Skeletonema marinoi]|uniref:Peptidase S1 domain-containing protein n=1 Tax=Skeletonema marinoi TaxID=267567 RepID=A0AAD9D4F6_9STRA|nr:hypothetical protein QTG54_016650 [Skeletonema marinoi]